MERKKVLLSLSLDAIDTINQYAPSHKKKGEWASQAIMGYVEQPEEFDDETGTLERMEAKLDRLMRMLAD